MALGSAADVGLGDLAHLDGGHDTAVETALFDGVLQCDCIDDGGEHAHVIGGYAIHVDCLLGYAAEKVASADDDGDLAAERVDVGDLFGYLVDEDCVDAEAGTCSKGFA